MTECIKFVGRSEARGHKSHVEHREKDDRVPSRGATVLGACGTGFSYGTSGSICVDARVAAWRDSAFPYVHVPSQFPSVRTIMACDPLLYLCAAYQCQRRAGKIYRANICIPQSYRDGWTARL